MVAEHAGVSVATVSNVLNKKPSVSPDFARRVHAAVRELGYVADAAASRLRSKKSAMAAVVVPDLTNPMFAAFVSTLEHAARLDGFDLIVVSARNDPAEEADRLANLRAWRLAGLIVIPCDGALRDRLPPAFGVPTVVADRIPDDQGFDLLAVDNGPAAGTVARHLAAQGFSRCLVVGTSLGISNVRERWEGALRAAERMRLEMLEVGFGDPPRFDVLKKRLRAADRAEALFVLDHQTALAVYRLLGEMRLAAGRDIAFASFDEMEWMRLVSPPVTSVRQPVEDMALGAWRQLTKRIAGDNSAPQIRRLRCAVEIRGSTPRKDASQGSEAASPPRRKRQ